MKNTLIKLTNMKSVRVGLGITEFRKRANLSQDQLANKVKVDEPFLVRLEEGCITEIDSKILENLARALNLNMRSTPNYDDLVNLFLYVPIEKPPLLI